MVSAPAPTPPPYHSLSLPYGKQGCIVALMEQHHPNAVSGWSITAKQPSLVANVATAAELKGNQQAAELKAGVGSLGGLKKSL